MAAGGNRFIDIVNLGWPVTEENSTIFVDGKVIWMESKINKVS